MAKVKIRKERCKGCGLCVIYCPHKLITLSEEINIKGLHFAYFSDREAKCTGCGRCFLICPDIAIEVYK